MDQFEGRKSDIRANEGCERVGVECIRPRNRATPRAARRSRWRVEGDSPHIWSFRVWLPRSAHRDYAWRRMSRDSLENHCLIARLSARSTDSSVESVNHAIKSRHHSLLHRNRSTLVVESAVGSFWSACPLAVEQMALSRIRQKLTDRFSKFRGRRKGDRDRRISLHPPQREN